MFFFFLPYKVNRTFKQIPILTVLLIATNTIFYMGTSFDLANVVKYLGFVANVHGVYTWFTSMFLHGDFFSHLLWNMYFLWLFGSILEDALGKLKFSLIYIASGLAACLVHAGIVALFIPQLASTPLIGASGAIAGLLGVFAVRFYKNKISIAYFIFFFFFVRWGIVEIASAAALSLWIGREFFSGLLQIGGLAGQVANWAHIGGFLFGAIIALSFRLTREADAEYLSEEADSWARMGVHSGALSKYSQLIADQPDKPDAYRKLARSMLFSENGEKKKIVDNYSKAIDLFLQAQEKAEALQVYKELKDAYSDVVLQPRIEFLMASLCESMTEIGLAAESYRKLTETYPDSPEAERAFFRLAHAYLKMGQNDAAKRAWHEFLRKYPKSQWIPFADSYFMVGVS